MAQIHGYLRHLAKHRNLKFTLYAFQDLSARFSSAKQAASHSDSFRLQSRMREAVSWGLSLKDPSGDPCGRLSSHLPSTRPCETNGLAMSQAPFMGHSGMV